jgi:hypothetical protein
LIYNGERNDGGGQLKEILEHEEKAIRIVIICCENYRGKDLEMFDEETVY